MKKKIIPIIIVLVIILDIVVFFLIKNNNDSDNKLGGNIATIVTIDTNIGYEIYLDKDNNVVKYNKYKDGSVETIKDKDTLDNIIKLIQDESLEYRDEYKVVMMALNHNGILDAGDIEKLLNNSDEIFFEMHAFDLPTNEDNNLAKEYKISSVKASLVNSVASKIKEVEIKNLVNKTIKELFDMDTTGHYCPEDYYLDGGICYKEIGTKEPLVGDKCPLNYYEYEGTCYRFGEDQEGEKLICRSEYTLVGDSCVLTETHDAEPVCEKGEYNGKNCSYREETGEPTEYCYDPNRYLHNHKCLATKPLLNGGCPGNENAKVGNRCVNYVDDMQDPSYSCPKGESMHTKPDGTITCILETKYELLGYSCGPDGEIQESSKCTFTDVQKAHKEKICINGSTLVDEDVCIIKNETTPMVKREYCDVGSIYKNNKCIIYEAMNAYKSGK